MALSRESRRLWERVAILLTVIGVASAAYMARGLGLPKPATIAEYFNKFRGDPKLVVWMPYLYVGFCAFCAATQFPRAVIILAAVGLFGPWLATLYTSLGGTLGVGGAFLASRYVARDFVYQRLPPAWKKWEEWISKRGFWAILAIRSAPFAPMSSLHYASGLTHMHLVPFAAASFLGFVVSSVFYVFFADVVVNFYKRYFDIPYVVPIMITMNALFIGGMVFYYRKYKKRAAVAPVPVEAPLEEKSPL